MTAILKVDTIQDTGGNTIISSDGSGNITTNKVGITEADQWRLTADITSNTNPISANLERIDNSGSGYLGTGMSVNSGIWTFPVTGLYLIRFIASGVAIINDNIGIRINTTTDNSTYTNVAENADSGDAGTGTCSIVTETFFNVTNLSNDKLKFSAESISAGSFILGSTDISYTSFTFIRLGDSV